MEKLPVVYILFNKKHGALYVGVTSDLLKRMYEHKNKLIEGFTKKYNIDKLAYFETISDMQTAIIREKQLKSGTRKRKIELIESVNPNWEDLYYRMVD